MNAKLLVNSIKLIWRIIPLMTLIIAFGSFSPQSCEASITDRICKAVTNFLNKESAKADTAVKDCEEKCDWAKKKQKMIASAQKKANDSCDKGIAPDMAEISKGLDKTAIKKLNKLYKANGSELFDGADAESSRERF